MTMAEHTGHAGSNGRPPSPPFPPPSDGRHHGGDRGARGRFAANNQAGKATRFQAGNKAATGCANPFQRQLGRIRLALATALSDEAVQEIVAAMVQMVVVDHSRRAARFLFSFVVGPPMQHCVDPDDLDRAELQKLRLEAQSDSLDNQRLSLPAALAIEQAYQLAASAGTLGEEL